MNNIIYEDNHIIVVYKKENIPVCLDDSKDEDLLTIIKNYLKQKYNKQGNVYLGLVHRLDRPVSGIMVFAKTSKAASRLSDSIRKNEFHKNYLAIVHGKIKDSDTFIDYLEKKDNFNTIVTDKNHGKLSELSYDLVSYNEDKNISLVKVNLKTGRHHQIRVQFSSRGYPLVGDNRYGIDKEKEIGLFAYKLSFPHPITKEIISFLYLPSNKPFNLFEIKKELLKD